MCYVPITYYILLTYHQFPVCTFLFFNHNNIRSIIDIDQNFLIYTVALSRNYSNFPYVSAMFNIQKHFKVDLISCTIGKVIKTARTIFLYFRLIFFRNKHHETRFNASAALTLYLAFCILLANFFLQRIFCESKAPQSSNGKLTFTEYIQCLTVYNSLFTNDSFCQGF